jgi:hypothetical protein
VRVPPSFLRNLTPGHERLEGLAPPPRHKTKKKTYQKRTPYLKISAGVVVLVPIPRADRVSELLLPYQPTPLSASLLVRSGNNGTDVGADPGRWLRPTHQSSRSVAFDLSLPPSRQGSRLRRVRGNFNSNHFLAHTTLSSLGLYICRFTPPPLLLPSFPSPSPSGYHGGNEPWRAWARAWLWTWAWRSPTVSAIRTGLPRNRYRLTYDVRRLYLQLRL